MSRAFACALALATLSILIPGIPAVRAGADEVHTLRLATLAPRGSDLVRAFEAWNLRLKKDTGGKVRLRIYPGGSAGDEKVVVRKMRAGQLDGSAITTTGLGMLVRPVLVLSAPGLITGYAELDAVRNALAPEFDEMFRSSGFELVNWGDVGLTRVFSKKPIQRPQDLRSVRPWVWTDNPVMVEFLKVTGANGVPLGVPEVYAGLQTGMIDTVVTSALSAVALQWFTRFKYVSSEASGVVVGALIIRKDKLDAIPEDARRAFVASARAGNDEMQEGARKMDEHAYRTLVKRGISAVDVTPGQRREWEAVAKTTRERLAGRLYSRHLLNRVEAIAQRARK